MKTFVGTDVIDLKSDANAEVILSNRYLEKQYSPKEQSFIRSFAQQRDVMWLMYSCKETAFKVFSKMNLHARFVPHVIEVSIRKVRKEGKIETWYGETYYQGCGIFHFSRYHPHWIHTYGSNNQGVLPIMHTQCINIRPGWDESYAVRAALRAYLKINLPFKDPTVIRLDSGAPQLIQSGLIRDGDVSFSHDETVGAFAYLPPK